MHLILLSLVVIAGFFVLFRELRRVERKMGLMQINLDKTIHASHSLPSTIAAVANVANVANAANAANAAEVTGAVNTSQEIPHFQTVIFNGFEDCVPANHYFNGQEYDINDTAIVGGADNIEATTEVIATEVTEVTEPANTNAVTATEATNTNEVTNTNEATNTNEVTETETIAEVKSDVDGASSAAAVTSAISGEQDLALSLEADLHAMPKNVLKEYLENKGKNHSGSKNELIKRIVAIGQFIKAD